MRCSFCETYQNSTDKTDIAKKIVKFCRHKKQYVHYCDKICDHFSPYGSFYCRTRGYFVEPRWCLSARRCGNPPECGRCKRMPEVMELLKCIAIKERDRIDLLIKPTVDLVRRDIEEEEEEPQPKIIKRQI